MAVPGSGNSLSLWGISKELTHDTDGYNNSIPVSTYQQYFFGSMSLHDMETQGSTYGHSVYDVINSASTSKPNGSNPNEMSEWYGYNHQAVSECLDKTNNTYSSSSNPTGCSISTAHSGSVSINMYNNMAYVRYDAKVSGIFTTRIYRSSSSTDLRVRVFKSNGQISGSGSSISGMTLQENATTFGYTTISFPVNANDEILIKAEFLGGSSYFSTNHDRTFINDLSSCQYTSYTEAKLFGPDSGTPSSSYYSTSSPSTITYGAYLNRSNSSAWSTVYIHHCTSTNPIEPGNTVYQTSNLTTKVSWSSSSSWRAITTDTSTPYDGIKGIYNGFHYTTTNIEQTYGDTN